MDSLFNALTFLAYAYGVAIILSLGVLAAILLRKRKGRDL